MTEVTEEELDEQLDDIDNFIGTFHRFSSKLNLCFQLVSIL